MTAKNQEKKIETAQYESPTKVGDIHQQKALLATADASYKRGCYRNALDLYTGYISYDPTSVRSLKQRARTYLKIHKALEALADANAVLELTDGKNATAYMIKGRALVFLARLEEALLCFTQGRLLPCSQRQAKSFRQRFNAGMDAILQEIEKCHLYYISHIKLSDNRLLSFWHHVIQAFPYNGDETARTDDRALLRSALHRMEKKRIITKEENQSSIQRVKLEHSSQYLWRPLASIQKLPSIQSTLTLSAVQLCPVAKDKRYLKELRDCLDDGTPNGREVKSLANQAVAEIALHSGFWEHMGGAIDNPNVGSHNYKRSTISVRKIEQMLAETVDRIEIEMTRLRYSKGLELGELFKERLDHVLPARKRHLAHSSAYLKELHETLHKQMAACRAHVKRLAKQLRRTKSAGGMQKREHTVLPPLNDTQRDYDACRRAAEIAIQTERYSDAIPLLKEALKTCENGTIRAASALHDLTYCHIMTKKPITNIKQTICTLLEGLSCSVKANSPDWVAFHLVLTVKLLRKVVGKPTPYALNREAELIEAAKRMAALAEDGPAVRELNKLIRYDDRLSVRLLTEQGMLTRQGTQQEEWTDLDLREPGDSRIEEYLDQSQTSPVRGYTYSSANTADGESSPDKSQLNSSRSPVSSSPEVQLRQADFSCSSTENTPVKSRTPSPKVSNLSPTQRQRRKTPANLVSPKLPVADDKITENSPVKEKSPGKPIWSAERYAEKVATRSFVNAPSSAERKENRPSKGRKKKRTDRVKWEEEKNELL